MQAEELRAVALAVAAKYTADPLRSRATAAQARVAADPLAELTSQRTSQGGDAGALPPQARSLAACCSTDKTLCCVKDMIGLHCQIVM